AQGQSAYTPDNATGIANNSRWGDYSGISIDPSDNGSFWAFNQYATGQTTWATTVAAVNVTGPTGGSLFSASNTPTQTNLNDGEALEVGMKFSSSSAGQITALKFYRSPGDIGSDLVDLWSSSGTKLASATFTNTTATGWQTVSLATPVSIAANTTY